MCRSRLWLLYWVSTQMRRMPALTRFDSAKSISRYRPPNGTAGLSRSAVSGASRLPAPPASTMPSTRSSAVTRRPPSASLPGCRHGNQCGGCGRRKVPRCLSRASHPDLGLLVPGLFPVGHVLSLQAVAAGEVDERLGAVIEVFAQHLVLRAFGAVEGEVEHAARRHEP